MDLEIIIPYPTLLKCRLDTTVLVVNNKDIRCIGEITTDYKARGWDYLFQHLPAEKDKSWWEQVRKYAEKFQWELYRTPSLPTVKPYQGTLEFHGGGGCHRAMALAIRGGPEDIPVILHL